MMNRLASQRKRALAPTHPDVSSLGGLLWRPLAVVVFVLAIGTAGYVWIEEWSFADALYMTVITMTTVGFGEVHPLHPLGRQFTMVLVVISVAAGALAVAALTSFIVEGHLYGAIEENRRQHRLQRLRGHVVLCGFGRVGLGAARSIVDAGRACVVIDQDLPEPLPAELAQIVALRKDATDPEVLREAGVDHAQGVICALGSDAENIMLALMLQDLAPSATVVARAASDQGEQLLLRAGADVVICPYKTGGERMAAALLRPGVHSFLEVVGAGGAGPFRLHEIGVPHGSPLIGKDLETLLAGRKSEARIVGIAKPWGEPILNPTGQTVLAEDDCLIIAGTREQIRDFCEALEEAGA